MKSPLTRPGPPKGTRLRFLMVLLSIRFRQSVPLPEPALTVIVRKLPLLPTLEMEEPVRDPVVESWKSNLSTPVTVSEKFTLKVIWLMLVGLFWLRVMEVTIGRILLH